MVKVLIIEDQDMARVALSVVLSKNANIEIADMAVVLVNQDGKAKIVDVQNFTIARGGSAKVNVEIKDANEFNTAIVTSESEWDAAKINTANIVVLGQVNIANAHTPIAQISTS